MSSAFTRAGSTSESRNFPGTRTAYGSPSSGRRWRSQAEWDALSGALATAGGAASALADSLESLEVHAEKMRANLDLTHGGIVAERVAVHLTARLGRKRARALAREASLRAAAAGTSLA